MPEKNWNIAEGQQRAMMLAADRKRHCGFKRNASAFEEPLFFSVSRIEAREDEDDHPFTTLHRPTVQYGTSPYKKWLASLPHMSSKQLVDLVKKMQPDEPMVGREKGELVAMLSSTPMNEACNALQMTKPMEGRMEVRESRERARLWSLLL